MRLRNGWFYVTFGFWLLAYDQALFEGNGNSETNSVVLNVPDFSVEPKGMRVYDRLSCNIFLAMKKMCKTGHVKMPTKSFWNGMWLQHACVTLNNFCVLTLSLCLGQFEVNCNIGNEVLYCCTMCSRFLCGTTRSESSGKVTVPCESLSLSPFERISYDMKNTQDV